MANAMFDLGRGHFLDGDIDWTANDIRFIFVDHADDTPDPATDEDLADISAPARVAESANLSGKSSTNGTADASDETVSTVSGDQFESIVLFLETGTDATSWLFLFIDTATGLPTTPNGGDITVQWDAGADKIFTL